MSEVNGGHIAARGEGRDLPVVGTLQVSAEQSGGSFEVILTHPGPVAPAGPPPHVHREHDELFYIIKGRLTFAWGLASSRLSRAGLCSCRAEPVTGSNPSPIRKPC